MKKIVVVMFLLLPSVVQAQVDSVRRPDVIRFADGVIHTYASPLRWKKNDWAKFSGILVGTAALTLADQPIRKFWIGQNEKALDHVDRVGYHYGKPYSGFLLAGGLYTTGLIFKNEWLRETGTALVTSLAAAGLLEMGLKPLIGRARPENERGNYVMTFFNEEPKYHSFPSGHASMAFTVSFVMAKRVESVPVKIFFYTLAGSTAVCRLYSDAHWTSDIAFGALLGWYCSEAVVERLKENRFRPKRNRKTDINLTPYPGGMTLRATFN